MSKHVLVRVKKHTPESIKFIETFLNESAAMLARHGETDADAKKLSRDFVLEVSRRLDGELMYFGKNTTRETQAKYLAIQDDYRNGKTIEELSVKYCLSTRRIHSIVHELKNTALAKSATTGAPAIAVVAARMMMKIGLDHEDAASAARGLLAVIAVKLGGRAVYIPKTRNVQGIITAIDVYRYHKSGKSIDSLAAHFCLSNEEIKTILDTYPAPTMPDTTELPKIKTSLFSIASNFGEYAEIRALLECATVTITRAEKIIEKLKGG